MRKPRTRLIHAAVIGVTLCALSPFGIAQEAEHHESLRERSQMFGDWGGARTVLAQRGIDVSYETVRRWSFKFGVAYARKLRHSHPHAGFTILSQPLSGHGLLIQKYD